MTTFAVIGGGITGLAAARRLAMLAPNSEVVVLESSARVGGKIATDRVDGFVIEGGPDSFLTVKPRGIGLCRELGVEEQLQGTRQSTRATFVLHGGRLVPIPEGLSGLVPSRLEPLLESTLFSPEGKARLLLETEIPSRPPNGDETLASFASRRFGPEAYERLIEPLMAGIYAGDGERLSLAATFPQLRSLELRYGSVVRGLQSGVQQSPAGTPPFATPVSGMGNIVDALRRRLSRVQILTSRAVKDVRRTRNQWSLRLVNGESLLSDAVIFATPTVVTAALVESLAPTAAAALAGIPFVSSATVSLGYRASDMPDVFHGHGYIVPRVEHRPVLACSFVSQKFAHRAPEGHDLIRCFIGRAGDETWVTGSDDDLVAIARAEVAGTLGLTAEPVLTRAFRWTAGMPQYTIGHLDRLQAAEDALTDYRTVALAGPLRGVGIPDCIASGEAAAEKILTATRI